MQPKQIPNILSFCRIRFSGMLLLLPENPILFLSIYLLTGITDVADGYLARKYGWTSRTGALLDSLADTVFYLIILAVIGLHYPFVITDNWQWLGLILVIKALSVITALIRFHKFIFIHTLANKIFGLLLFCVIPLMVFSLPAIIIKALFIIALLPALEELMILFTSKDPDVNQKSLFQ